MQFFRSLILIATFAYPVFCAVLPKTHVLHEKRDHVASAWVKRDRIRRDAILPIRIGLSQANLHKGHDLLMQVSDPTSPLYGQHWTSDKVDEFFAPSDDAVESVMAWLVSSGIGMDRITHSDNKGWLAFDASTQESEDLFAAEFHEYEHERTGDVAAACDEYHLPKHVQRHVDYVTPGIRLIPMKKRTLQRRGFGIKLNGTASGTIKPPPFYPLPRAEQNSGTSPFPNAAAAPSTIPCNQAVTPGCISELYQVPPGTKAKSSNKMGIYESQDAYSQEDLDGFWATVYPRIPQGTGPKLNSIDGGVAPVAQVNSGLESTLDFELAYPLLWPQETILYQTGLTATFNSFLDAIDGSYCTYSAYGETGDDTQPGYDPVYPDISYGGKLMCGKFSPTNVISISYGGDEWYIPAFYQQRQCNEFMKLGLKGHSVVIASGDDGVGGTFGCIDGYVFSPGWPATCPYVTTVGGTKIQSGKKVTDPEIAMSEDASSIYGFSFATGGGFSNVFPIPSYQAAALKTYFGRHNPPYLSYSGFGTGFDPANVSANGGLYNRIGRGIPDVAANGDNITVYSQGQLGLVPGTSASTPIFGAIINRINEERLAVGKSTVGFVNPVLYANADVLNDITKGSNPGCGTDGFSAVSGWDPATGLGTPNYPKMLKLFLSLP